MGGSGVHNRPAATAEQFCIKCFEVNGLTIGNKAILTGRVCCGSKPLFLCFSWAPDQREIWLMMKLPTLKTVLPPN